MHEDQMWLEECVDNDPWKNVEIAPMFQYPVMENDFLSDESSQTPPEKDIAAALVLLKIRHRISTKGIDDLCKLLKMLKMSKAPKSFYRIKRLLLPNPSAPTSEFVTYICPVCCEATTSLDHCSNEHCTQHKRFHAPPLYYLRMPILQQLREILDHAPPLNFEQQQEKSASNSDVINDIYDAEAYRNILKKEAGKKFLSLIMNVDGIQIAKNSNLSLWIFTFVINEVKRSERFRLKNVIVGGIVSAVSKPDRHQMQALLSPIVKELLVLEQGEIFTVRGLNESSKLHLKTFLIASCCDKPAQSLVQGISEPTGAFGCGRCELQGKFLCIHNFLLLMNRVAILGETVAIKKNSRKKIRVFPLIPDHQGQPRLRTNKTYDIFMKVYAQERLLNHVELRDRLRGHISPCVLRELTYFDVGTSFLSDSLHNVYHGVMKRLLHLWFNKKYRKQPWSIYSKLNVVDRYLSSINYPSTTVRIPRSLSKYEQYKANELRSILLFGFPALCSVLPFRYARHLLLLAV
ncbi:unnamed protein product [Rotaria sordida]|uniref:Uncharacterized protein n=1 Tax=Rotaria sordida TaxID=392033 RepID=A0A816CAF3_9BILA|nr:unnamed protein product [Rotaria sordida]CAF1620311.1 unnamed protein product [Rotaria sordida]